MDLRDSLADLMNTKLRRGLRKQSNPQDVADAIGLIRKHHLGKDFAAQIDKKYRRDFRKLLFAAAAMKFAGESPESEPIPTAPLTENIETTNPSNLGFVLALLLSIIISISACIYILAPHIGAWGIFLSIPVFGIFYAIFAATFNTNKYIFDVVSRRILVENRWFLLFSRRSAEYSFDEIKEIKMWTTESSGALIILRSGRKFSVKTNGDFRRISALCDRIATMTGKHKLFPTSWK